MSGKTNETAGFVSAETRLNILGRSIRLKLQVPTTLSPPESVLPALHTLANTIVGFATEDYAGEGKPVSCKQGCDACCYQSVPVSASEARAISVLVENMPEPRRAQVLQRFSDAIDTLRPSGIFNKMDAAGGLSQEEFNKIAVEYYNQGVPCPFLENKSCSIYENRPLICREYAVTSPAENCAQPTLDNIEKINLPVRLAPLYREYDPAKKAPPGKRLPLVLALEWTAQHPDDIEYRSGTEWLRQFFSILGS